MPEKIFQAGYMSGDSYSASAYLAIDPDARIILVKDSKEPQDKTGSAVLKFYRECGLAGRVDLFDISQTTIQAKQLWTTVKDNYKQRAPAPPKQTFTGAPTTTPQLLSRFYYDIAPQNSWPRSITAVTGLLANVFESSYGESAQKVAALWKIGKFDTDTKFALWEYAGTRFAKTGVGNIRKNIVVIWSRQSGKNGGAHVELDSSYAGIKQLVDYFAPAKATVILAGDERNGKLAALAAGSTQVVNCAEMWKDQFWSDHFAGVSVLAQLAFFKFLEEGFKVIHVGMRSGMLETMGLLGMTTFYLEPDVCPSGDRMLAFSRANIPYTRIQIQAPPGLTAWDAQTSIESGVPAPTLNGWRNKLDRQIDFLMHNPSYRNFYYYSDTGPRGRRRFHPDQAQRDAEIYAKSKIMLEKNLNPDSPSFLSGRDKILDGLLQKSPATVKAERKAMRGFYQTDLDKITGAIESQFRA
jgi:hypothetical protein